eukprot:2678945-Amphidinium_carterae.1
MNKNLGKRRFRSVRFVYLWWVVPKFVLLLLHRIARAYCERHQLLCELEKVSPCVLLAGSTNVWVADNESIVRVGGRTCIRR